MSDKHFNIDDEFSSSPQYNGSSPSHGMEESLFSLYESGDYDRDASQNGGYKHQGGGYQGG
jgi:hypothetical protein